MTRRIEERDAAKFPGNWAPTDNAILENIRFGSIRHRVIMNGDKASHDQPHYIEPGGAAMLPIAGDDGRVGLVRQMRPALLKENPTGSYPDYPVTDFGREVWEAPRGFRKLDESSEAAALREFMDECGVGYLAHERVGQIFTNSAIMATPIDLYLVKIAATETGGKRGTKEGITEFRVFSSTEILRMIDDGEMACAFTLGLILRATLRGYLTWGER